jgi:hypothetical protein
MNTRVGMIFEIDEPTGDSRLVRLWDLAIFGWLALVLEIKPGPICSLRRILVRRR